MTNKPFPPVFATNRPGVGETVADEVNRMLAGLRMQLVSPPNIDLATAYLNPQGFALIADEVEQAPKVRILLGAEPEEPIRRQVERGDAISFEDVSRSYLTGLREERNFLGFTAQADAEAHRLVAWLRSIGEDGHPRVEVRRFTKGFLHGKAFIATHPALPAVLAGSSNLTLAGLSWNRELNLGYPSGQYTSLVIDWFNELWEDSEDFDLAGLFEERWIPYEPRVVFLRMLHELYGKGNADDLDERIGLPVTEFQRDGIVRAIRIVDTLGGVLVCDEVGLGKTFIAGELIRLASQRDRQKVLVVVPAALKESTWMPFLRRFDLISARVEVVTFDELRLGTHRAVQHLDDYSFVVIDEAHNLRNANTLRAEAVMELLWGEYPKKVVLLTATPVNNSLHDLRTLIAYFVRNDAQFAPIGIPSVADYISAAQKMDPNSLSPEHLFDLMDQVAVRRTRRFIKKEYTHDMIRDNRGDLVPIEFPTPVVQRITYTLDKQAQDLADKVIHALQVSSHEELVIRSGVDRDPTRLSLARYAPSLYHLGADVDRLEITNVGLLRSGLLKRLESSTAALSNTLQRLISSHNAFIEGLDAGVVLVGDALKEYANSEADSLDDFLDSLDGKAADQVTPASEYELEALRRDVVGDVELLEELLVDAKARAAAGLDAKVLALIDQFEQIAREADKPDRSGVSSEDRRKVIIFSTYTDAVVDVHKGLVEVIEAAPADSPLAVYKGRVAPAIFGTRGRGNQDSRAAWIAGFCPKTAGELDDDGNPRSEDLFDILVTTDVLAEGVNLQQAGRLISFDLPFNPMKLVQRHGRIDRIGSPHRRVFIGVFFPAKNLDVYLKLEAILQRKIAYANAAIGVGKVLPDQIADPNVEVLLHDSRADIMGLFDEDATILVEGGGSGALSGEEYRRRLARSLADPYLREMVEQLPNGAGSGFRSKRLRQAGYVFCARISDHDIPWFRFVAVDSQTWEPAIRSDPVTGEPAAWVEGDTLKCLVAADPGDGYDTAHDLPEEAAKQVFSAWAHAQSDIHAKWSALADWANLQPRIEKALREAIDLVAEHGGHLPADLQGELIAKLNGRWERNIVRAVREIIRDESHDARRKVDALLAFVTESGLTIPEQPDPLPPVRKEDIRLVCWIAVQPEMTAGSGS